MDSELIGFSHTYNSHLWYPLLSGGLPQGLACWFASSALTWTSAGGMVSRLINVITGVILRLARAISILTMLVPLTLQVEFFIESL